MGGFSIVHWIVLLIATEIYGIPLARILFRIGYSRGVVILALVPIVNVVTWFIILFAKWPIADAAAYRYSR